MKAPKTLRPESRRWFSQVVAEFALEAHHEKLLLLAAEAWDRGAAANEVLRREGLTFLDKHQQPRVRPEAMVAKDSALVFMRALRELDLEGVPPPVTRPPPLNRNRRSGQCRPGDALPN